MATVEFIDGAEHQAQALGADPAAIFVEHPGRVFSRTDLLSEVWGISPETNTRTVDTHIAKLRAKIGDSGSEPRWILTIHGMGYKFIDPA